MTRERSQALALLRTLQARHAGYRDVLVALATMLRDAGEPSEALAYARKLSALDPARPDAQQLVRELEQAAGG